MVETCCSVEQIESSCVWTNFVLISAHFFLQQHPSKRQASGNDNLISTTHLPDLQAYLYFAARPLKFVTKLNLRYTLNFNSSP
jgi:hypothetical protein